MNPISYELQTPELPFKDQRGGLKTMGVVLIVLGAFCGCLGVLTPATMLAPRPPGVPGPLLRDLIVMLLMYVIIAFMFITIGVGSLRIQRWSKPAVLVLTGTWAVSGIIGLLSWLIFMPSMQDTMNAVSTNATTMPTTMASTTMPTTMTVTMTRPTMSPTMTSVVSLLTGFFMAVFMVLLPAGLFWFYRRETVSQTLNYFDPTPTWTDRCPTPVLAMSFWMLVGGVMTLGFALWAVTPAFGTLLTGRPAMGVMLVMSIVFIALAIGIYLLKPAAWWVTALVTILGIANVLTTFTKVDPYDVYRLSGTPAAQVEMMQRMGIQARNTMIVQPVLYGVGVLGYLLWIRRYFRRHVDVI